VPSRGARRRPRRRGAAARPARGNLRRVCDRPRALARRPPACGVHDARVHPRGSKRRPPSPSDGCAARSSDPPRACGASPSRRALHLRTDRALPRFASRPRSWARHASRVGLDEPPERRSIPHSFAQRSSRGRPTGSAFASARHAFGVRRPKRCLLLRGSGSPPPARSARWKRAVCRLFRSSLRPSMTRGDRPPTTYRSEVASCLHSKSADAERGRCRRSAHGDLEGETAQSDREAGDGRRLRGQPWPAPRLQVFTSLERPSRRHTSRLRFVFRVSPSTSSCRPARSSTRSRTPPLLPVAAL
jgi:hypothetical protein